jgi:hypothetical protein
MEVTMRTEYRIAVALAVGALVTLLAAACGDGRRSITDPSPVGAPRNTGGASPAMQSQGDVAGDQGQGSAGEATLSEARANTTAVCHIEGNGTFHLIHINPNALDAHLNHGDVLPHDEDVCPEPITTTAGR